MDFVEKIKFKEKYGVAPGRLAQRLQIPLKFIEGWWRENLSEEELKQKIKDLFHIRGKILGGHYNRRMREIGVGKKQREEENKSCDLVEDFNSPLEQRFKDGFELIKGDGGDERTTS